jgi:hypothetical protein
MSSFQEVDEDDVHEMNGNNANNSVSGDHNLNPTIVSSLSVPSNFSGNDPVDNYDEPSSPIPEAFTNGQAGEEADPDVASSFENIIPPQVSKGFGLFYNWASKTANTIKEKAKVINESDTMKEFKQKTSEVASQAAEVATPLWEKAVTSVSAAAGTASEQAVIAAERMQPTFDSVCHHF